MNEIELIKRRAGIVTEASLSSYLKMFNDLISAFPQVRENVTEQIQWSRQVLIRDDRIVWFLRIYKAKILSGMAESDPFHKDVVPGDISNNELAYKKYLQNLSKKSQPYSSSLYDQQWSEYIRDIPSPDMKPLKEKLTHMIQMSNLIPQINDIVFQWQSPEQLFRQFNSIESAWQEKQDSKLPLDERHDVIITFPDGYAWYDLNTGYCSDEARAMGHCGNVGGGGTILSLRETLPNGYVFPVLTFILHSDGLLGEMKGRGNDKPVEKYHKYIIPLLRNYDEIVGIKGGGYMPENNFKMRDLEDEELRLQLIELKPGLANLYDYLDMNGWVFNEKAEQLMDEHVSNFRNMGYYSIEGDPLNDFNNAVVVLEQYRNLDQFLDNIYDSSANMLKELMKYYDDPNELLNFFKDNDVDIIDKNAVNPSTSQIFHDIIDRMPDRYINYIAKDMGVPVPITPRDRHLFLAKMENERSRFIDYMIDAYVDNSEILFDEKQAFSKIKPAINKRQEKITSALKKRINKHIDVGLYFKNYYVYIVYDKNDFDKEVTLRIPLREYINVVTSDDENNEYGDSEYTSMNYDVQQEGWEAVSDSNDYSLEEREDLMNLVTQVNKDDPKKHTWEQQKDRVYMDNYLHKLLKALPNLERSYDLHTVIQAFTREFDIHESSDTEEVVDIILERILSLAGIKRLTKTF